MRNKIILILVFTLLVNVMAFGQSANDIVGLWYGAPDSKKRVAVVEIYSENGKYYGYSFAYQNSTEVVNDVNNPKKELQNLPLKGLVYLYDLKFNNKEWSGGKIYNPDNGKTFNAKVKISDDKNQLSIRASIDGAGLMGKTLVWKRIPSSEASKYKPLSKSELRKLK